MKYEQLKSSWLILSFILISKRFRSLALLCEEEESRLIFDGKRDRENQDGLLLILPSQRSGRHNPFQK